MSPKLSRMFSIMFMLVITVALWPSPAYSQSFWCGGDLTNLIDPNVGESLQEALEEACSAIRGALFSSGSTGDDEPPPTGVLVHDPEKVWAGYTLLSSLGGQLDPDTDITCGAFLIDMQGTLVKKWPLVAYPARMLPGGHIMDPNTNSDKLSASTRRT